MARTQRSSRLEALQTEIDRSGAWYQDGGGTRTIFFKEELKLSYFFVKGIKKNDETLVNSENRCLPGDTSESGDVSWPPPLALKRWWSAQRFSWVADVADR